MAKKRKVVKKGTIKKGTVRKSSYKGRKPSHKNKDSKVKKLIRLAKARKRKKR